PLLKYIFVTMIKLQSEAVDALADLNKDEYFDPGDDVDKIELLLHHDPSTPKISIAFILEGLPWIIKTLALTVLSIVYSSFYP
nr:hypothetical protein [Tanacetum cinerariifolium]